MPAVAAVIAIAVGSLAASRGQETATRPRSQAESARGRRRRDRAPAGRGAEASPTSPASGSDIVAGFEPPTEGWNYERRTAMVPMRDGVRLYTVIVVPKQRIGPMPIVLTRTPYDADGQTCAPRAPTPP